MNIYVSANHPDFQPTYLYVKRHLITGLKYFGKTTKKDPIKYLGSGTYWTRHLEKHGKHIETLWHKLFTNKDELVEYALNFSMKNNIVESTEWANLKPEDGLRGGGVKGIKIMPHTLEHKNKISIGVNKSNQARGTSKKEKIYIPRPIRPRMKWSEEAKIKHSAWQIGIPKRRICCIFCHKDIDIANFKGRHGDKCKMNPVKKIE